MISPLRDRVRWSVGPRAQFVLTAVTFAGVTGGMLADSFYNWMGGWHPTASALADTDMVLSALALVVGAIAGARFAKSGLTVLASTSSRSMLVVHAREIWLGVCPVLVGWGVVAATALILTLFTRPYGTPPVLHLVMLALSLTCWVSIGYAAAFRFRHPAIGLVLVVASQLGRFEFLGRTDGWQNLVVSDSASLDYGRKSFLMLGFQSLWLAGLLLLAVALASKQRAAIAFATSLALGLTVGLMAIPPSRTFLEAPERWQMVCRGQAPTLCLTKAHANNYPRMASTLEPLRPLMAAAHPGGITLTEASPVAPPADGEVNIALWSRLEGQGAWMDRGSFLTRLAPTLLGYADVGCFTTTTRPNGAIDGLNFPGEVTQWFLWRYDIAQDFGPDNMRPVPKGVSSSGLAVRLRDTPDDVVFAWLRSPKVKAALASCSPDPNAVPAP